MEDKRNELLHNCEIRLTFLPADLRDKVTDILINEINNYEIIERCTDIVPQDGMNEKLLKRYLACLTIDGKSEKTVQAYGRCLIRFGEFIGKPFTEVGPYDVRFYLAKKKQDGNGNSTLETIRAYLSAFYQWMLAEEVITKNPMGMMKPIKVEKKIRLPFSAVELDALRNTCSRQKDRAIIELLVSSGVRVEELSNLDVTDINFTDMSVRVRNGKGGKDRTTYMGEVAAKHLQKYILSRKEEGPALFYNKNHERLQTGGFRDILRRLGKAAGVENVHPHRFRRTFATNLAKRGMDIQQIQRLMGHSNLNTTMIYVYVDSDTVSANYKKFTA